MNRPDRSSWAMTRQPGTYALLFVLEAPLRLTVGRLGDVLLPAGPLAYVGSARGPGGVGARLARHMRREKPVHWHVDVLTAAVEPAVWWVDTSEERLECAWVRELLALPGAYAPVAGFGSSDCREGCPAHLVALREAAGDGGRSGGDWPGCGRVLESGR